MSTVERSVHCHCHGINLVLKLQTKPGYVLSLSIAHACSVLLFDFAALYQFAFAVTTCWGTWFHSLMPESKMLTHMVSVEIKITSRTSETVIVTIDENYSYSY